MSDHDEKPPLERPPLERLVELIVLAPIGLLQFVRDLIPPVDQLVERGRARVEELQQQVGNQVVQAKIVGQYAVAQGRERISREVDARIGRSDGAVEPPSRVEAAIDPGIVMASGNGAARGDASQLPIPDYDELSASQVVARLAGLTREELSSVRDYEESQRQRKTILTRIEQLSV